MLRRCERLARTLYRLAIYSDTGVGQMTDRHVARMYCGMIAPSTALASETFDLWEHLPQHERQIAVMRMRHALAKIAPRKSDAKDQP